MLSQLHSAVLAYITLAKDRFRDGAQPLGLVPLEDEVLADVDIGMLLSMCVCERARTCECVC